MIASVAQWIRHRPPKPGIAGSSPAGGWKFFKTFVRLKAWYLELVSIRKVEMYIATTYALWIWFWDVCMTQIGFDKLPCGKNFNCDSWWTITSSYKDAEISIGGIAQWQSIRLQIERSPVQLRLPPFLFWTPALDNKSTIICQSEQNYRSNCYSLIFVCVMGMPRQQVALEFMVK